MLATDFVADTSGMPEYAPMITAMISMRITAITVKIVFYMIVSFNREYCPYALMHFIRMRHCGIFLHFVSFFDHR
jgi:hypothetical protein